MCKQKKTKKKLWNHHPFSLYYSCGVARSWEEGSYKKSTESIQHYIISNYGLYNAAISSWSNLRCFTIGNELFDFSNQYRKLSLPFKIHPIRLLDTFYSSESRTFYRIFLAASVEMISNFSCLIDQLSD